LLFLLGWFNTARKTTPEERLKHLKLRVVLATRLEKRLPFRDNAGNPQPTLKVIFKYAVAVAIIFIFTYLGLSQSISTFCMPDEHKWHRPGKIVGYGDEQKIKQKEGNKSPRATVFYPEVVTISDTHFYVPDGKKTFRAYPVGTEVNVIFCGGQARPVAIDRGYFNISKILIWLIVWAMGIFIMSSYLLYTLRFNKLKNSAREA
jgi:hypothetical protein